MNKTILNNCLTFFYDTLNTHSVSFDLFVKSGIGYEKSGQEGISNLLANMHYRGLDGYVQKQLFYKMESIGSSLEIYAYKDFMKFSMKAHPKYYAECTDIIKAVFNTYYWNEELLEKEKKSVINKIFEEEQYIDINEFARNNIFGNMSFTYPIHGNSETICDITLDMLSNFKRKLFSKNNIIMCVSGALTEESLNFIESSLSTFVLADETNERNSILPKDYCKRKVNIFCEERDWECYDVDLSFDIPLYYKNTPVIDVLNCILGEGIGSRLQILLREENAIVFNIKTFIEKYEEFNVLHIQYSVQEHNFSNSLDLILNELNQMKCEIKMSEIETALPFFMENSEFLLDDPKKYNFNYAYNNFILNKSQDVSFDIQPDDITALAKKIFVSSNMTLTYIGKLSNSQKIKHIVEKI